MRRTLLPILIVSVLVSALPGPVFADSVQDLFGQANELYWAEDYENARTKYLELVEKYRIDNAELNFNLGNACAKTEQLGSAVLYYKRALRYEPRPDTREAIEWNLDRVRTALVSRHRQQIDQNRMLFDESRGAWYALFHVFPEPAIAVGFLVFWLSLVAFLVIRRLRPLRFVRATGISLLVLTVLFGVLLTGNVTTTHTARFGIIIHDEAEIRGTRTADSPARAPVLPEGLEVQLLDGSDEGLQRVQILSTGREGWVKSDSVKEI